MDEMSLARHVLGIIDEQARGRGFQQVRVVWLEIGRLSGVQPEVLRECFDEAARGGIAEGACLEVVSLPGEGWCLQCEQTIPLREQYGECPSCGGFQIRVTQGTEIRIKGLDVD